MLNSLGGMELLFPILENVGIQPKQFPVVERKRITVAPAPALTTVAPTSTSSSSNSSSSTGDSRYSLYNENDGKKEIFNGQ